jgi:hypothetical protein
MILEADNQKGDGKRTIPFLVARDVGRQAILCLIADP